VRGATTFGSFFWEGPQENKEDADLKRLIDILRAANYRGHVALEYEAAEEPKKAIPQNIAVLKKLW
jgi:hypothetical protein